MSIPNFLLEPEPLDIIVEVNGDKVIAELDIRNNASVNVGDLYTVFWGDGITTILRVTGFKSASDYSNTIARRAEAMREGVAGVPESLTARRAYQIKLAVLHVQGEILADGSLKIGANRVPDVMLPLYPITDEVTERFMTQSDGNLVLGNLRSGRRVLDRPARIRHNYAGDRMVVFGMPGKGKSQMIRSLLSQAMAEDISEQTLDSQEDGDEL